MQNTGSSQKVVITKGLPAAGKDTWALEQMRKFPGKYKRVNKDLLRVMADDGKWSKEREKFIENLRDQFIIQALIDGYSVIVSDTNLASRHENRIRNLVASSPELSVLKSKPEVEVKFFDVDVEECIARDAKREPTIVKHYVGAKVIRKMYNQFIRKIEAPVPVIRSLDTPIVICDLDGTLAQFGDKNPYNRDFINDIPNVRLIEILRRIGLPVWIFSGRSGEHRCETFQWLFKHNVPYTELLMRLREDNRKDVIVKKEFYEQYIKDKYNVFAVFDDRPQVCRLWYELGLPLFKIGDPDADF